MTAPHALTAGGRTEYFVGSDESSRAAAELVLSELAGAAALFVARVPPEHGRGQCDLNRDAGDQLGRTGCPPTVGTKAAYGVPEIESAARAARATGFPALLLDIHSYDGIKHAMCRACTLGSGAPCERWRDRSQCRPGWAEHDLMIGRDASSPASLAAADELCRWARAHGVLCALWDADPHVNFLVRRAREAGCAALLLEFNDRRGGAGARAVGQWARTALAAGRGMAAAAAAGLGGTGSA